MKLSLAITLAALSLAGAALAQEPQTPPAPQTPPSPEVQAARLAMRQACLGDVQTYCQGQRGREALMCLRSHDDKISGPCKDAMAKMPQQRRRLRDG
jgi:hypothetical protein